MERPLKLDFAVTQEGIDELSATKPFQRLNHDDQDTCNTNCYTAVFVRGLIV